MIVCKNAEILVQPCGNVKFSRAIVCRAGLENDRLRSCSESHEKYEAVKNIALPLPKPKQVSASSPYVPNSVKPTAPSPYGTVIKSPDAAVRRRGCGACGKGK